MENKALDRKWIKGLSVFLIFFGLLTLKSGGSTLFNEQVREAAGNYVPFVLWSNFIAGFFYIASGIGIFLKKNWGIKLALIIAIFNILLFSAFGIHIFRGGLFEAKTLGAMVLRTLVWGISAFLFHKYACPKRSENNV